jgi:hypothetical protein
VKFTRFKTTSALKLLLIELADRTGICDAVVTVSCIPPTNHPAQFKAALTARRGDHRLGVRAHESPVTFAFQNQQASNPGVGPIVAPAQERLKLAASRPIGYEHYPKSNIRQ